MTACQRSDHGDFPKLFPSQFASCAPSSRNGWTPDRGEASMRALGGGPPTQLCRQGILPTMDSSTRLQLVGVLGAWRRQTSGDQEGLVDALLARAYGVDEIRRGAEVESRLDQGRDERYEVP